MTFQQTFQAPNMNGGTCVDVTSDDGFIVTGQHQSSGAGGCDIYVFRRDACGNLIWFNTYGGAGSDGGMGVIPTSDGGFIVTGLSEAGGGGYDASLIKLDGAGAVQWAQWFGAGGDDRGLHVQETADGGYIMSGQTTSFGAGGWDAYLVKTDNLGNLQWSRTYGGGGADFGNSVEQTSDGGYVILGSTGSFGSPDLWIIKTDATGNIQWNRTYGGPGTEGGEWYTKGFIANDGGFVIASHTNSFGAGSNDILVVKTDSTGVVQWSRAYGGAGNDQQRFIRETFDGGLIITGFSTSFGFGGNDYYLLKTDSFGALEWSYVYGGGGADKAMGVQQAGDGGFVMSGNSSSFAPGGGGDPYDAYIVKTDSMGIVGCHQDTALTIVTSVTPIVIAPTPTVTTQTAATVYVPTVISYTPTPQVLCLDCDVSFANFKYCDNGLTVNFIDSSICATNWNWYFGDGGTDTVQNPVHTYLFPGTYNALLITQNISYGCDDSLEIIITLDTFQIANFSRSNVCHGETAYFTDQSDTSGGVIIIGYYWLFGDGDTSVLQSPSHLYAAPGTYQVSLVVSLSTNNCTDTVTKSITIHPRPAPNFNMDTACALSATQFIDSTQILTGSVVIWQWDFGDGGMDSVQNPTHIYTFGGNYNAQLIATSDMGCADSITLPVMVHYTPAPLFSAPPVCYGTPMSFTDMSTIGGDVIVSWAWDFGDLNVSTMQNPSNAYLVAGLYNATLLAFSDQGCVNGISDTVVVNANPVPLFTAPNSCLYSTVDFVDQSFIQSGAIQDWYWDFGDGTTSTISNPSHLYTNIGTYNIYLALKSDSGCKDTLNSVLEIYEVPVANYSAPYVCAYDDAVFTDQSTISTGAVTQWTWLFGDSYISTEQNPIHFYGYADTFNYVVFVAISNNGCVDTLQQTYVVHNVPDADFEFTTVCFNDSPTVFTDSSTLVGDPISTWDWDFGDGTTSTVQHPNHSFQDSGLFDVQLTVTSPNPKGCIDVINKWVLVRRLPTLKFDMDTAVGCAPFTIEFTNSSFNSIYYHWGFGDGSPVTAFNEPHTYEDPAVDTFYTVSLAGETIWGCKDTLFKIDTVSILPNPIAEFLTVPNPATLLHPYITFTNISSGNLDTPTVFMWDFGDNTTWIGFDTIHTYSNIDTGTYEVELIVVNRHGCRDTFTTIVIVEDAFTVFVPTAFTPNGDGVNDVFFPAGIGITDPNFKFSLYIYDRWGDLIYKSDDASKGWDGIANKGSRRAQEDVYVWMIKTVDISADPGLKHQYMGHVTLIK